MNVNKVMILGNLTRDPETKTTPNGQTISKFGVATNRYWTDKQTNEKKQQVEYHNIVCWRKLAEIAQKFLKKGDLVYVEGRLQTSSWDDQQGNKKYKTDIVAERIQLGPKGTKAAPTTETPATEISSREEEISPEEIPF